jgi:hypothetical protein
MSFPGTYNINYYYGDTLEFRVFPKNSAGDIFDLSTFTSARFTVAPNRNAPIAEHIFCFAQIDADKTNILCAIRPEDSAKLNPDANYVYDIEVSKSGNPYPIIYTLLNGNVSITRDVTKPSLDPEVLAAPPNNPTNLQLSVAGTDTLEVSWTEPTAGDAPTLYKVAIIPFTTDISVLRSAIGGTILTKPAPTNSYAFVGLQPGTAYSVIIRSSNAAGDADINTILTNGSAFSTISLPPSITAPSAPTINSINALDEELDVLFTPGSDGGSPILNYQYSLDGTSFVDFDPVQLNSPLTITGLTNGVEYTVSIKAVNEIGESNASNSISATPVETPPQPEPDFFITNSGSGAYLIDGVSNDTITLVRGETYIFDINASGHPFWIQTVPGAYSSGNIYNDGITGNGTQVGTITWTVDQSAPSTLYYVCQFHPAMAGTILIIDAENGEYDSYDGS